MEETQVNFGPPRFVVQSFPFAKKSGDFHLEIPVNAQYMGVDAPTWDSGNVHILYAIPVADEPKMRIRMRVVFEGESFGAELITDVFNFPGISWEETYPSFCPIGQWTDKITNPDGTFSFRRAWVIEFDEDPQEVEEKKDADRAEPEDEGLEIQLQADNAESLAFRCKGGMPTIPPSSGSDGLFGPTQGVPLSEGRSRFDIEVDFPSTAQEEEARPNRFQLQDASFIEHLVQALKTGVTLYFHSNPGTSRIHVQVRGEPSLKRIEGSFPSSKTALLTLSARLEGDDDEETPLGEVKLSPFDEAILAGGTALLLWAFPRERFCMRLTRPMGLFSKRSPSGQGVTYMKESIHLRDSTDLLDVFRVTEDEGVVQNTIVLT